MAFHVVNNHISLTDMSHFPLKIRIIAHVTYRIKLPLR